MPLKHSKTPAAFKQNIRTEMHAGKPQKQAVAIAYSEQRRAAHKKHARGGEIEGCKECMDEGGQVSKPTGSNAGSNTGASALGQGYSSASSKGGWGWAKGGEIDPRRNAQGPAERHFGSQKGVNKVLPEYDRKHNEVKYGTSEAGHAAKWAHENNESGSRSHEANMSMAKAGHKETLSEMREMPNPKLKGLAEGGEVDGPHEDLGLDEHDEIDRDYDDEIGDILGQELMEAIHSKDHKKIMESIEAVVLQCLDKQHNEEE